MLDRALFGVAFADDWGRQMRFITGPRQAGKTTLAKLKLAREKTAALYYLWDLRTVRDRYKQNPLFFTRDSPPRRSKRWVCFDEIHKMPKWKNILKGIFDSAQERYQFVITGSAKLDIFRRAGDSLSGRFFTFHLFPLGLFELTRASSAADPPKTARDFASSRADAREDARAGEALADMLEYGGFPEPFIRQSGKFHAKWAEDYTDTVIKEDIGALTRIIDKEYLYDLYNLLPEMVGSPISESFLASHLELSNPTVKSHLNRLEDFFLAFRLHPYAKNIKRALLKAPKCYLYDWSRLRDAGKKFENFTAVQLSARLSLWTENSEDRYSLFYVRTRQNEETDFLILKNNAPWLLLEAKLTDGPIDPHHGRMQAQLGGIPFVQLCREEGVLKMEGDRRIRMSASRFLA